MFLGTFSGGGQRHSWAMCLTFRFRNHVECVPSFPIWKAFPYVLACPFRQLRVFPEYSGCGCVIDNGSDIADRSAAYRSFGSNGRRRYYIIAPVRAIFHSVGFETLLTLVLGIILVVTEHIRRRRNGESVLLFIGNGSRRNGAVNNGEDDEIDDFSLPARALVNVITLQAAA